MARLIIIVSLSLGLFLLAHNKASAQGAATGLVAVNHALYSEKTELFEEYTPLIVGQTVRSTAHLTKLGDTFIAYTDATVDVTLTIEGVAINGHADGPERPGVFRVFLTPTRAGTGRMEVKVVTKDYSDRFVIDGVQVYPDMATALARQIKPDLSGTVSYSKEKSWDSGGFATAPVRKERGIIVVPGKALFEANTVSYAYVQRTPERFEKRRVSIGRIYDGNAEVLDGLRDGERIVVNGIDQLPR